MIYTVMVGVALSRPPRTDEYRKVMVEAPNAREAMLLAAQIAACTCTMPVSTEILEPDEKFKRTLDEVIQDHMEALSRLVD